MKTHAIIEYAKLIESRTAALKWLEEYGLQITQKDGTSVGFGVRLSFASACPGASDAAFVLGVCANGRITDLVQVAIDVCRKDIAETREKIRKEVDGD